MECVLKFARAALGAPGEQIKEGEEGVAGTTFDEPDEELRGPPPQPGAHVRGFAAGEGRIGGLRYMGGTAALRAPSGVSAVRRCGLAGSRGWPPSRHAGILKHTLSLGEPFLPDAVIGWQEDPRLRKPSAYPALAVLERFALRPEQVLVLDDLKPGLDMAMAAGVRCAGAGWGHDIPEIRSAMSEHCHWYFKTIEMFSRFLFGQSGPGAPCAGSSPT